MAAPRYLANVTGKIKEVIAAVVSAANSIVATDASGRKDISMLPVGVGAETIVAASSENLAAGAFVNFFLNAAVINVRNADNSTNAKPAHGFVLSAVTSPANATVFLLGQVNTAVTALTIGSDYFLGVVGAVVTTAPSASGNIVQLLGRATKATELPTESYDTIEIA